MKKTKNKNIHNEQQAINLFSRVLHSKGSLRLGLSKARRSVDIKYYPVIVKTFGEKSIYKSVLSPVNFPKNYDQYSNVLRLGGDIGDAGEILWTASVLSLYEAELRQFVTFKNRFYENYVSGKLQDALDELKNVEDNFGVSFWLISNKIQILQELHGLKEQKDYLEEILVTKGFSQTVGWLSYYASLRSEEGVTYSNFKNQIQDIFQVTERGDFAICKIIPLEIDKIKSIEAPISWTENNCIIDRFETLVPMLALYAAKNGIAERDIILGATKLLKEIDDSIICKISAAFNFETENTPENLSIIDSYTEGKYEEIIEKNPDNLELVARSYAAAGNDPKKSNIQGIKGKIIEIMHSIITLKENLRDNQENLKKFALICYGHSFYYQILSFLERQHDHLYVGNYSVVDKVCALCGDLNNPWSQQILAEILGEKWSEITSNLEHLSTSFSLRRGLYSENGEDIIKNANWLPLPRKSSYLGHYFLNKRDYKRAIECYQDVAGMGYPYLSSNIKKYLLEALVENGSFKEALHLTVDHIAEYPSAASIYPINDLSEKCIKESHLLYEIDLAILLHIAIIQGHSKFERDISNIYENVLDHHGIAIPSDLTLPACDKEKRNAIYFLKNVCIQRVMDDSTSFNSVDEIDEERIRICQKLLSIDLSNKNGYLDEIRTITKDLNVARLFAKVQTSKIFVDEIGIRQVLDQTLKGSLNRFKLLLESPSLAYQAEKLSRILGDMLSDKGHPEFRDLKLPATELEGLFTAMLLEATSQFALNPAYGLDTHVSTSIRHGAFEGHLRSPLAVENLLCKHKDGIYILPDHWAGKLAKISKENLDLILKSLGRFSNKIEVIISVYLKEKLHIKIIGKESALFSFYASSETNKKLMDMITIKTELNELIEIFIRHCWKLTTQSLEAIQKDIVETTSLHISNAFDQLSKSIEPISAHEEISSLTDSIARARTASQAAIFEVASWFQKPKDLSREPFEFEMALEVASKQIYNCYLDTPLKINKEINVKERIEGKLLDGICEIIFILLQNVIRHGGLEGEEVDVTFSASYSEETLVLESKNALSDQIDFDERVSQAMRSMETYEQDTALRKARDEGGSGLSKIWRIAEFTLKVEHTLLIHVDQDRFFSTKLTLKGIKVE